MLIFFVVVVVTQPFWLRWFLGFCLLLFSQSSNGIPPDVIKCEYFVLHQSLTELRITWAETCFYHPQVNSRRHNIVIKSLSSMRFKQWRVKVMSPSQALPEADLILGLVCRTVFMHHVLIASYGIPCNW